MKKGLLAIAVSLSTVAFAQQAVDGDFKVPVTEKNLKFDRSTTPSANKSSVLTSEWFSYVDNYEAYYGTNLAENNFNMCFPDSTVLVNYGASGYGAPWIHGLAQTFDMNSDVIKGSASTDLMYFNPDINYTIDSMAFYGFYTRVQGSNIVDTLIVRIYEPANNQQLYRRFYFQGTDINTNLGADTVYFIAFEWDFNEKMAPGEVWEEKIAMDDNFWADTTAGGLHFVDLAVNQTMMGGGIFGVTWDYKPGASWTPNVDTLGVSINSWRFMSWELNGANSFPFYDKKDNNMSHTMATDVRYNTGTSWDGLYIPSVAYMGGSASFAYEAHSGYYKITQDVNVSVGEDNLIKSNIFPNPSNGEFKVQLADAGSYNFRLLNIIGQEVFAGSEDVDANGIVPFNFSHLDKGVYLLSIESEGKTSVQKITLR